MKFLVADTQARRHGTITSYLTPESAVIAVLLAAVDLEWTIRRAIYCLGTSPISDLKGLHIASLPKYDRLWRREVRGTGTQPLAEIVEDWDGLQKAFGLRHTIVHGAKGTVGAQYAKPRVDKMLGASVAVVGYCKLNGVDLYSRLKRRRPQ